MRMNGIKIVMTDINKCQSKRPTSDQTRVEVKFVTKGTTNRSNRLKYFNKVISNLSQTKGTYHSNTREADEYHTSTADVYPDADIALVETVTEDSGNS